MALVKYQNWAVDEAGNIVASSAYEVRDTAGVLVSIYSDAGGTAASNPGTATSGGLIEFYAEKGVYDITVGGGPSATTQRATIGGPDVAYFASRADAVAASDAELDGRSLMFDGYVWYKYSSGATAISDLPDWVPEGDVTPLHFGENSSADYSSEIQAASDYLVTIGGGTLKFLKDSGPYVVSNVSFGDGVYVDGGGSEFTVSDLTVGNVFIWQGSVGSDISLTSDVSVGDTTLTVSSTSGMSADDFLILRDAVSYTSSDAGYKNGELVRIESVDSSTQVTIVGGVLGTIDLSGYTVANGSTVSLVSTVKGGISDAVFSGDATSLKNLIRFKYADSPVVSNVRVNGHGNSAVIIESCADAFIGGCNIRDLTDNTGNGQAGYGVVFAQACSGGIVSNNSFENCRHAFTTTGGAYGFPHGFKVCGNTDRASHVASFDTHASAADYEISGNMAIQSPGSGVTFRGPRGLIKDNYIIGCVDGIRGAEDSISDVIIEGNTILDTGVIGIKIDVACPNLKVFDNRISRAGNRGMRLFNSAGVVVPGCEIIGNKVESTATDAAVEAVVVYGGGTTDGVIVNNVIIKGDGSPSYGIRAFSLASAVVSGNIFVGTFTTADVGGGAQVSDTFTTTDGKTVTVVNGVITGIV